MNVMNRLAVRQLLKNRKRTLITLAGIIISVSMVTAVAGFVASTRDMMRKTYIAHGGDFHAALYPVTGEKAQAILSDGRIESGYTEASEEGGGLTVYFRIKDVDRDYADTTEHIADDYGVVDEQFIYHKELLAAEGVIASDRSLTTLYSIASILGLIIITGSVIVIANAFYISASERTRQFGVLKSAGATKEQIRRTVLAEGMILSLIGIPLGILAGFIVEAVALAIANNLLYEINRLNEGTLHFSMIISPAAITGSAVISLITVLLSAWLPAGRAAKTSAIDAIKLTNEIKIRPGQVRVSPLIGKIFGFEGSLAAKALKRSRGKYRATVISLVVSITLFILASGFGLMALESADIVYKDYGINVLISCRENDAALISEANDRIMEIPGGKASFSKFVDVRTPAAQTFFTEDAKKYLADSGFLRDSISGVPSEMRLISVDAAAFEEVCRSAGVSAGLFTQPGEVKGILVNTMTMDIAGKRIVFEPFNYNEAEIFTVTHEESGKEEAIELVGEIKDMPAYVAAVAYDGCINVVLPEASFEEFSKELPSRQAFWVASAENSGEYSEAAERILEMLAPEKTFFVFDYEQGARMARSINLLIMIFVYGFVGMLSFIAVTSVVGTISTNINLRLPEFAMLSSTGMTDKGLKRMLNLESLFYGLKALFIGVPLGGLFYFLLFKAFGNSIDFAFIWPWKSMLICVLAVMAITFGTMRYSTKKLAGRNIVDSIKEMNL